MKIALDSGIQQFVPTKNLSFKCSLPWITQEIRRLMRKRDKLYQKTSQVRVGIGVTSKGSKSSAAKIISHENYLADILGVGSGRFSPKKLFSLFKNSRQDNQGISTLKDSENKPSCIVET